MQSQLVYVIATDDANSLIHFRLPQIGASGVELSKEIYTALKLIDSEVKTQNVYYAVFVKLNEQLAINQLIDQQSVLGFGQSDSNVVDVEPLPAKKTRKSRA